MHNVEPIVYPFPPQPPFVLNQGNPRNSHIKAFWPILKNSNEVLRDLTGRQPPVTPTGTVNIRLNSLGGYELDFNGVSTSFNCLPAVTSAPFTVSFWASATTYNPSTAVAIRQGTWTGNLFTFDPMNNEGGNGVRIYYNNGVLIKDTSGGTADGKPHLFVFTSRSPTDHEIWVDCVSKGTSSTSKNFGAGIDFTTIGDWYAGSGRSFQGQIFNVRIEDKGYSQADVAALWNQQTRGDVVLPLWLPRASPVTGVAPPVGDVRPRFYHHRHHNRAA